MSIYRVDPNLPRDTQIEYLNNMIMELEGKFEQGKFDKNDIEFWIEGGTLLGIIRDKKLISWDTGIDLCIWNKSSFKLNPNSPAFRELHKRDYDIYYLDDKIGLEKD